MRLDPDVHRRLIRDFVNRGSVLEPAFTLFDGRSVPLPPGGGTASGGTLFVRLFVIAAAALMLAGCAETAAAGEATTPSGTTAAVGTTTASGTTASGTTAGGTTASGTTASGTTAAVSAPGRAFGGTDLAWIEVTLAMNEQAIPLLDAIPAHTRTPAVTDLATKVRAVTEAELPKLRTLHDQAGLPADNPHEGMPMPGMVTESELEAMTRLSGTAFDTAATNKLHEGLTQAINLARSEQSNGADPDTRALAGAILSAREPLLTS